MDRKHFGQHGAGCGPCRWQSVSIAPSAMPTRHNDVATSAEPHNSWERGEVRDATTGMPIVDSNLDPVGVHEWQSMRSRYERDHRITVSTTAG
jgi:hypothetical protein